MWRRAPSRVRVIAIPTATRFETATFGAADGAVPMRTRAEVDAFLKGLAPS